MNTWVSFEPAQQAWVRMPDMLAVRCAPACAVLNGLLYVAGGQDDTGANQQSVEAFNPSTNTWTRVVSDLIQIFF